MRRGIISAGDLVEAIGRLDADDKVARQIALLLGLAKAKVAQQQTLFLKPFHIDGSVDLNRPAADVESLTELEAATFLPSRIERRPERKGKRARLSFRRDAQLPPTVAEEHEPPPAFEPLLRPVTSRAIVSHALSTRRVEGVDVDLVVERIARRERLDPLPLRRVATMRRGVQLLVDGSTGMTLFRRDQAALTKWIEKVVGSDRITVGAFIGTPRLRYFGTERGVGYAPPSPHTPVVLLTDLGIGQPSRLANGAGTAEWLDFAAQLRRARCPAIAFVPYPRSRWPLPLRRAFTIVEWDRALTASRARRPR